MAKGTDKLLSFFGLQLVKKSNNEVEVGIQSTVQSNTENPDKKKLPKEVSQQLNTLLDWYQKTVYVNGKKIADRQARNKALDFMIRNEDIMSMAVDLYADEGSQADVQTSIVGVEAPDKKVSKRINELLQSWGVNQSFVRTNLASIAQYGEGYFHRYFNNTGVTGLEFLNVHKVLERMEFKPSEIKAIVENLKDGDYLGQSDQMRKLADLITQKSKDSTEFLFQKYLLGYRLSDGYILPPWAIGHCRLRSHDEEFEPYGKPLFINSLASWNKLVTIEDLMALARLANFPKEYINVKTHETMSQEEQWEAVWEFVEQLENVGAWNQKPDNPALNNRYVLPDGLASVRMESPNINISDISDAEFERDKMIIGTRVPKGYLITDRGSFGVSGQSLLQQSKPFGRSAYSVQSAFLLALTETVKLHFVLSNEFQGEATPFSLSLNFPVTEESRDRVSAKSDTLRLATDIIGNIQSALGTRDGLPPEIVKKVFSKVSFLDPEDIEDWINAAAKAAEESGSEDMFASTLLTNYPNLSEASKKDVQEKIKIGLNERVIKEASFIALKENNIQEGIKSKKHFLVSTTTNQSFKDTVMFSALRSSKLIKENYEDLVVDKGKKYFMEDVKPKRKRRKK